MKYRQTVLMALSLGIIILFFMPWVVMQEGFDMFAESENSGYSGFELVRGIQYAAPLVSSFGNAYGFPLASKLIYLGYVLWLIPILGILAIVLSGLRNRAAYRIHRIQFIGVVVLGVLAVVGVSINADIRELYTSVLSTSLFFWLMLTFGLLGILVSLKQEKKR